MAELQQAECSWVHWRTDMEREVRELLEHPEDLHRGPRPEILTEAWEPERCEYALHVLDMRQIWRVSQGHYMTMLVGTLRSKATGRALFPGLPLRH